MIEAIDPGAEDELILLGDYVDRGPDSRDVVDQIIELQSTCRVIALRGNHEIMLLGVALHGLDSEFWLRSGGQATLSSYGGSLSKIPARHLTFFQGLRSYYETSDSIFVHAGYKHDCSMSQQGDAATYWCHLTIPPPPPHQSGKRVFVGHTPQAGGNILDFGHLVCVDTYCFGGGFLTALDVDSFDVVQANLHGHLRRTQWAGMQEKLRRFRQAIRTLFSATPSSPARDSSPIDKDVIDLP